MIEIHDVSMKYMRMGRWINWRWVERLGEISIGKYYFDTEKSPDVVNRVVKSEDFKSYIPGKYITLQKNVYFFFKWWQFPNKGEAIHASLLWRSGKSRRWRHEVSDAVGIIALGPNAKKYLHKIQDKKFSKIRQQNKPSFIKLHLSGKYITT